VERRWREQKERELAGLTFADDVDELERLERELQQPDGEDDDMMVDAIAREEEEEIDAMVSMFQAASSQQQLPAPPDSANGYAFSDDEDYDSLFMDFVSQDDSQDMACSGEMDIS
jgi:hypothetical protein